MDDSHEVRRPIRDSNGTEADPDHPSRTKDLRGARASAFPGARHRTFS